MRLSTSSAAGLLCLAVCGAAQAVPYEAAIRMEEEQDLYELQRNGEISEATLQTLLELHRAPIDLDTATRDELYVLPDLTYEQVDAILRHRETAGRVGDPSSLVEAGVLSAEALQQIAPFLLRHPETSAAQPPVSGSLRLASAWAAEDALLPPAFAQLRLRRGRDLRLGIAATFTRRRLGAVSFDASRDALLASPPAPAGAVPKFFLQWDLPEVALVLGTFRVGFGQRLTLDNTGRYTPDGFTVDDVIAGGSELERLCRESQGELEASPCAGDAGKVYVTPDFRWSDGFRGVAATLRGAPLAGARLRATAFGSYQSRSIYQYELLDRRACADPSDDAPGCAAPPVFLQPAVEGAPASRVSLSTLPELYDELAGGGNVSLLFGPRTRVGLTGYYAAPRFRVDEMQLDFRPSARTPFGGPHGAVGADGAVAFGPLQLFLEVARSFDSMPSGGGLGVVQRSTLSWSRQELELALRFYDRGFANPYARSVSAPMELEGLRTRNEAGARLRFQGGAGGWRLRGSADLWGLPEDGAARGTAGMLNLDTAVRADFVGWRWLQPAAWVEYRNKDLARGGREQCFESSRDVDEDGATIPCAGELLRAAGRLRVEAGPRLSAAVQYQHALLDDARYAERLRQDSAASVELVARPGEQLRLRGRVRHLFEDVSSEEYLERSLWAFLEASWNAGGPVVGNLRYDWYAFLDRRASTQARRPSPEHRLRIELETRF